MPQNFAGIYFSDNFLLQSDGLNRWRTFATCYVHEQPCDKKSLLSEAVQAVRYACPRNHAKPHRVLGSHQNPMQFLREPSKANPNPRPVRTACAAGLYQHPLISLLGRAWLPKAPNRLSGSLDSKCRGL